MDGNVERIELIYLTDRPGTLLPMPAHQRALVTVVAEGHSRVLQPLLDVVSAAWRWCIADRTRQALDPLQVFALRGVELIVH